MRGFNIALPGMLHARVLRAPAAARCRVLSIDLDAARRTPGVRAVLGPEGRFTMGEPPLTAEPGWAGEPIAAVAADTPEAAEAGLVALALELEEQRRLLDEGLAEQRFTEEPREVVRGDPDAALASADARVELTCETPAHVQRRSSLMQPSSAGTGTGSRRGSRHPGMFDARRELARRFDLVPERVRVISEYIGGGFGGKQGIEALLAAELARAPVRLALSRHEDQLVGGRRAARARR